MAKFIYQYSTELEFSTKRADGILEWNSQILGAYGRFKNLSVIHLHAEDIDSICERSMRLQCNISDGELSMHSDSKDVYVKQEKWQ